MLFQVNPSLQHSAVFDGLHRFFRELLLATLDGREVDEANLPVGLCAAIAANQPTQTAIDALAAKLTALEPKNKKALKNALTLNTAPSEFLCDRAIPFPIVPKTVYAPLKTLAVHLFERTAKLSAVERVCGESVDDHYARFRNRNAPGNGNLCCVCGTEYLAQIQTNVDDNEQWRGPYDHLLAKDHYPLYGVDPTNLLPICTTCNSKAKLAKNLVLKDGVRRLSFSPWTESASLQEIAVVVDDANELFPRVIVKFQSADRDRKEKLTTWDEVYKITSRVEGEFKELGAKLAEDAQALDEATFLNRLRESKQAKFQAKRLTPFNYWRARVYAAVLGLNPGSREALRLAIMPTPEAEHDMEELFF